MPLISHLFPARFAASKGEILIILYVIDSIMINFFKGEIFR